MDRKELITKLRADKEFRDAFMSQTVRESIAAQVKELRTQHGLSRHEFADRAQIAYSTAFRLENPKTNDGVTIKTLLKIAFAFDVALIIKFVSFSRWLVEMFAFTPKGILTFEEDAGNLMAWAREQDAATAQRRSP
ncbi:MAG TPA: helix-turn-helix transcriptional regulator [Pyrinomonadaceae bacterium]|nr:helix-turn-helix transcriptional regulator [Pyrinomonadaceae bacterium]